MSATTRRVLSEPLLHFLVLGTAVFGLYACLGRSGGGADAGDEIVVSRGRVQSLVETFSRQWSRPPSDDELAGLVRDFVREEVLSRDAIALGLDRDDTIVRRRLAQKMEFLMDDAVAVQEPTDGDLREFLEAHPDRFLVESRFSFSQVLLDRARHGDGFEDDVASLLAVLNAPQAPPDVSKLGDGRMLPARFDDVAKRDVETQLGAAFATSLERLPIGRFAGPVESGYGAHLVRVERRVTERVPSLDEVRDAVAREWTETRRREAKDAQLEALLARHRVTIEPAVTPSPGPVMGSAR